MGLLIRKMKPADLDQLYLLLSDPLIMRFLEEPYSKEQTEQFLACAGLAEAPLIYAAEKDGEFIGYVIYHDYDLDSIEIGWVLNPSHWGKGYASKLTEQMIEKAGSSGKHLIIECSPEQNITRHIAFKYGFEHLGTAEGLEVLRL